MYISRSDCRIFRKKSKKRLVYRCLIIVLIQLLIFFPGIQRSESQPPNPCRQVPLPVDSAFSSESTVVNFPDFIQLASLCSDKPEWRIRRLAYNRKGYENRSWGGNTAVRVRPFEYRRLERDIWKELALLKKKRLLIPGDEVSVRTLDLTGGRLLASINADKKRMAASLIKPFVMLAVYDHVYHGKLKRGRWLEKLLRRMIVVSNNWATNRLVRLLGKGNAKRGLRAVNRVIRKYRFYHTRMIETIPPGGRTYRNYTTARDLSRFFYLLYHKRLVSQRYSELMMRKFLDVRTSRVRTYILRRDGVPVADKTGFVCGLNGDAGIVFQSRAISGGRDYIFVLMVENKGRPNSRRWRHHKTRVLRCLSNKIYLAFRDLALKHSKTRVVAL